jgi:hypothetical protein
MSRKQIEDYFLLEYDADISEELAASIFSYLP